MRRFYYVLMIAFLLLTINNLTARSKRVSQIPNGSVNACANCHVNPAGGGVRNAFGQEVEANSLDNNGDVIWEYALARLDSDGDGIPNGVELLDPNAFWSENMPAPGELDRVRNPGNANSFHGDILTVQFEEMTPHVGQKFEIRIIDQYDRREVIRKKLDVIPAAEYQMYFDGIEEGHSYYVDFYADLNNNKRYDPPAEDHAWRLEVNDVKGDTIVTFTHNTDFTDINWNYLLTVSFSDMSPHVGQQLEMRLIDQRTLKEVNRATLDTIKDSEFNLSLSGLEMDEDYRIDFYADFNNNKRYDSPPTDHVWRLELEDSEGDTTLPFVHNTDFVDTGWEYQLHLQLSEMTPHLGQLFEARVFDILNQKEVGRAKLEAIPRSDFQLEVVGLDSVGYYRVDFYSDHNGNKLYNSPAEDHAWRIETGKTSGNTTVHFMHNTDFTDIDWHYRLRLEISDLTPHLNQKFEARVVEKESGREVGRASLQSVHTDEFELFIPGIRLNTDYDVDFYADFNQNGVYDAPPDDHAWRLSYNPGDDGDNNLSFSHNTDFKDIQWAYLFKLALQDMDPHVGQMFEIRLVEPDGRGEVERKRIREIVRPSFTVPLSGLKPDMDYRVDFYADLNQNMQYDAPPTDHAWREMFAFSEGDTTVLFTHNTNFTDIQFPTSIAEPKREDIPNRFALYPNYPNPFNPVTTIAFDLPETAPVTLTIFNSLGQKVRTLLNSRLPAGHYQVRWNGLDRSGNQVSSGIYYYRLEHRSAVDVRRMMFVK